MNELAIIKSLIRRSTSYHGIIAKATGSVKLAVLWGQIEYWKDKTKDPNGWIYKSRQELYDELGMSRKEIETARELGMKLGILDSEVRGTPPTVHFRVNYERTIEVIGNFLKQNPEENFIGKVPAIPKELKSYNSMEWLKKISDEDMKEIMEKYSVDKRTVLSNADNVITYCESKGKKYTNYKAALMNFIKGDLEKHPEKRRKIVQQPSRPLTPAEKDTRETRTPEEQKKINDNLAKIRESFKGKFIIKKS